jgi:hypothetical protein
LRTVKVYTINGRFTRRSLHIIGRIETPSTCLRAYSKNEEDLRLNRYMIKF